MGFPLFSPRRLPPLVSQEPLRAALPANTRTSGAHARGREVAALLLWTAALFLVLAMSSYAGAPATDGTPPLSGANWVGPVGEAAARGLVTLLGLVAWAVPFEIMLLGIPF